MIWYNLFKSIYNTKPNSQFTLYSSNIYSNNNFSTSVIDFNKLNLISLNNISYFTTNPSLYNEGLDERNLSFLNFTEPSEEDILLNYCKYILLNLFLDSNKSIIEKIDQLNSNHYLLSNNVYNLINITKGGLMDEWNYEIF